MIFAAGGFESWPDAVAFSVFCICVAFCVWACNRE